MVLLAVNFVHLFKIHTINFVWCVLQLIVTHKQNGAIQWVPPSWRKLTTQNGRHKLGAEPSLLVTTELFFLIIIIYITS